MHPNDPTADLSWALLPFSALHPEQLYSLLHLRSEVFVVEQNCVYQDLDGMDRYALHLMGSRAGQLVCYARLLPPGLRYPEASIGRVINHLSVRGSGAGRELMRTAIEECLRQFGAVGIRISAQQYLERFYSQLGFKTVSAPYPEDGIPHIEMLLG